MERRKRKVLTYYFLFSSKFILSRGKLSIVIGVLGPTEYDQGKGKGRQEKEI